MVAEHGFNYNKFVFEVVDREPLNDQGSFVMDNNAGLQYKLRLAPDGNSIVLHQPINRLKPS
ncbi:hypothetical protein D5018_02130 [Parashewanella curva]|uniref:Uncharacterized protein n=1 Tax=Parashewanella curva TaxID=2338552 RepID=A0A3L8Q0U3_9GAMM|nr:hypothetical protein D5018_02130 [Parashewanella curva]